MPRVTVIGTGYLGLTHAVCLADLGHEVLAIDVDATKIAKAARGEVPFFEPGLEPLLRKNLDAGRLRFTMSFAEVGAFGDLHFLCVGTPEGEGGQADLSSVYGAAEALAPHLASPCLVVGKSTVPVGTARQVMNRMRAIAPACAGVDVAWNPEFLREGFAVQDSLAPDRIVLGVACDRAESAAPPGVPRAARGGHPAARHGPGDGRTGQGGRERVPGDQDLLHQRHGRDLRGVRRRRDTARRGARLRRADRQAVLVPRPRLRRRLPAQGHPRVPRHRRGPGRELTGQPAGHGGRDQPRPPGPGGRAGPPGGRRFAGGQAGGGARRRVQAQQRRRPGLPQPGHLRPAGGRGSDRVRARPGGHAQRGRQTSGPAVRAVGLRGGRGGRPAPAPHRVVRLPGHRPRRPGRGRRPAGDHRRALLPGRRPMARGRLDRARPGRP